MTGILLLTCHQCGFVNVQNLAPFRPNPDSPVCNVCLRLEPCCHQRCALASEFRMAVRTLSLAVLVVQFYSWYYHTLPFLLWQTNLSVVVRLALLVGVEFGFNIFPSTPVSSAALQVGRLKIAWQSHVYKEPCDASPNVRTSQRFRGMLWHSRFAYHQRGCRFTSILIVGNSLLNRLKAHFYR